MLEVTKQGGVARVTLNRPELRNAFDDELIRQAAKLSNISRDGSATGDGPRRERPGVCAGADLNWMKRMAGYDYEENLADATALAQMLAALDRLPKPTIARVHGLCLREERGSSRHATSRSARRRRSSASRKRSSGSRPPPSAPTSSARWASAPRGATSSPPRSSTPRRPCGSACCRNSCRRSAWTPPSRSSSSTCSPADRKRTPRSRR